MDTLTQMLHDPLKIFGLISLAIFTVAGIWSGINFLRSTFKKKDDGMKLTIPECEYIEHRKSA